MLSNEADVILKENCLTDFINTLLLLFKKNYSILKICYILILAGVCKLRISYVKSNYIQLIIFNFIFCEIVIICKNKFAWFLLYYTYVTVKAPNVW